MINPDPKVFNEAVHAVGAARNARRLAYDCWTVGEDRMRHRWLQTADSHERRVIDLANLSMLDAAVTESATTAGNRQPDLP